MSACDLGALFGAGGGNMGRMFSIEMFHLGVYRGRRAPHRAKPAREPVPVPLSPAPYHNGTALTAAMAAADTALARGAMEDDEAGLQAAPSANTPPTMKFWACRVFPFYTKLN